MQNSTDMDTNNIDVIELGYITSDEQTSRLSIDEGDASSVERINSLTAQMKKIEQQNRMMKLLAFISICVMIVIFLLSYIGLIASDVSGPTEDELKSKLFIQHNGKSLLAEVLKEMEKYKKESKYKMRLEPEDLNRLPPTLEMHLRSF